MQQEVEDFDELISVLRGMRGEIVEASVFLPWEDSGWPVATFAGTLRDVQFQGESSSPHWDVSWESGGDLKPHTPGLRIWERRFLRAELSFTGDADEGLADLQEGQERGQNIFLKIYSEGWIVDLISYV